MTAYEKAHKVIADIVGEKATAQILYLLDQSRIRFAMKPRSDDMSTRFHAHCWYLAKEIGKTKAEVYSEAVEYAMSFGEWPTRTIHPEIEVGGEVITVDVDYPMSSTFATNQQVLKAYEYIQFEAEDRGIKLPENVYA